MNIVVLDGYTANPGDLNWDKLQELGKCTIYERTAPDEVLERAAGAEVLLTNKVVLNSETIAALPDLKYIGVLATGYNVVDIAAARERGIIVTNIPAYSTPSVGQMVFAHILNITQQVRHYSEKVTQGDWSKSSDFCFYDTPLIELLGKKNRYRRIGTDRIQYRPYSYRFRHESLGRNLQIASATPTGNQESRPRPGIPRV